jgi:hypothetical protein
MTHADELQWLVDRTHITDAIVRYTIAVDTRDWELLDSVFVDGAAIDYRESGGVQTTYPESKKWLAETLPTFFASWQHTLGQVAIEITGDEADVVAYFMNPMVFKAPDGSAGNVVDLGGYYEHRFVRTSDGWRSRSLNEKILWKRGL